MHAFIIITGECSADEAKKKMEELERSLHENRLSGEDAQWIGK